MIMNVPLIIHIPHASTHIPGSVREQFVLDDDALERELLLMTDQYTDELFAPLFTSLCQSSGEQPGATALTYGISRLVTDPERFRGDSDEPMASRGMGAVYMKTAHGLPLRRPLTQAEREACLRDYYDPHHARLTDMAQEAVTTQGQCLIIDAHSFPSHPLPCDQDQTPERSDICIGTDPFHTPSALSARAIAAFQASGFSVSVDVPYAGALVPLAFYGRDKRVMALMVEVNRRLYMDEDTGEKLAEFDGFEKRFRRCLAALLPPAGDEAN